jgi:hypothetical protein
MLSLSLAALALLETFPMVSLPLTLGGHRTTDDGAFSWGMRPEVIASRIAEDDQGWGAVGYVQDGRAGGNALDAAGLTLVGYAGRSGIALSGGYYEREGDTGPQASLFFGPRGRIDRDVPLDAPFGVRVDAQLGGERSLIFCVQLDTTPLLVHVGVVASALSTGSR